MGTAEGMHGHIIVSGEDALATTIVEELQNAGASIVKLCDRKLAAAGIGQAVAVVCAGDDDATNLEIALLARQANPNVRVVARVANDVLRAAMAADNGPSAILDVADLAAPAIVEACLAHTAHPFEAAGIKFVVWGADSPRDTTLRELYGDLAPVAVIGGQTSSTADEVVVCPGRDLHVHAGDWTAVIGTAEELAARAIKVARPTPTPAPQRWLRRMLDAARTVRDDVNPAFFPLRA
jgi:Trk K+ transport system NAD-binding subunit